MARKTLMCSRCHYSKLALNDARHCQGTGAPYELLQAHQDAVTNAARMKSVSDKRRQFAYYNQIYFKHLSKCIKGQLEWSAEDKREAMEDTNRRYENATKRW